MSSKYGEVWENYPEIQSVVFVNETDESFFVGRDGVTEIRKHKKTGEHGYIPYVQIFKGDVLVGECCEHKLDFIQFKDNQNE